jgi:hypothetical protein
MTGNGSNSLVASGELGHFNPGRLEIVVFTKY